jgi:hypothetical protein
MHGRSALLPPYPGSRHDPLPLLSSISALLHIYCWLPHSGDWRNKRYCFKRCHRILKEKEIFQNSYARLFIIAQGIFIKNLNET